MRQHVSDEDFVAVEVNHGNQSKLVAADVEHRELAHLIRTGKHGSHVCKVPPVRSPDDLVPSIQRRLGQGIPLRKPTQLFARDDMHASHRLRILRRCQPEFRDSLSASRPNFAEPAESTLASIALFNTAGRSSHAALIRASSATCSRPRSAPASP